jgi:hypothetical protein
MRQRRETVELAAYAASHPGLDGSAHGKTARLSIEVAITFSGLFIFQLADGRHVCLWPKADVLVVRTDVCFRE